MPAVDLAERQSYALAHPLNGTQFRVQDYRWLETKPDGNTQVNVLAVDR